VHTSPKLYVNLLEFLLQLTTYRLSQYYKLSFSRFSAYVRKSEKVKGLRFSYTTPFPILCRKTTEFDQACFAGMHLKAKS